MCHFSSPHFGVDFFYVFKNALASRETKDTPIAIGNPAKSWCPLCVGFAARRGLENEVFTKNWGKEIKVFLFCEKNKA